MDTNRLPRGEEEASVSNKSSDVDDALKKGIGETWRNGHDLDVPIPEKIVGLVGHLAVKEELSSTAKTPEKDFPDEARE